MRFLALFLMIGSSAGLFCLDDEPAPNICQDASLDAALELDGEIYFFKDAYYWRWTEQGLKNPLPISSKWPCAPPNIDAAHTSIYDNFTYFFKGSLVWGYNKTYPLRGFPKRISEYDSGLPSDLTAAVMNRWEQTDQEYFFKGHNYYCHKDGKPEEMARWNGIPGDTIVDAAVKHTDGFTYLFVGHQYYKYDDTIDQVSEIYPPYPLSTATHWFLCNQNHRGT